MEMLFTQQTSLDQHRNRFLTDDRCHQHLFAVRWPQGFVCPACSHHEYYEVSLRKLFQCKQCHSQTSATAGTIMHRTRTPLRYWFWGIYFVTACNGETTAKQLSEKIGLNYHAARRMLGKIHEIEKNQDFLDLLKSFKIPQWSKEELSTGPGMETPPRSIKGSYPLIEQTIPDGKKPEIPGYSLEEVIFKAAGPGSGVASGKATGF